MGRKVYITSDMSVDEQLSEIAEEDPEAALLWPWILTFFDDWGRAPASTRRIKAAVFPSIPTVTPDKVEAALQLYARVGLIVLYEVDGKRYMAVPQDKWFRYQTHIRRDKRADDSGSQCPPPPDGSAPERGPAQGSAQVREGSRDCAQVREDARICIPSPSPSNVVVVARARASDDGEAADGAPEPPAPPPRVPTVGGEPITPPEDLRAIGDAYMAATGRPLLPGDDVAAAREALAMATQEQVVRAIELGARSFRPKYPGDRISSFRYFLPVLRRLVAEEEAAVAVARASPAPARRVRDFSDLYERGA